MDMEQLAKRVDEIWERRGKSYHLPPGADADLIGLAYDIVDSMRQFVADGNTG